MKPDAEHPRIRTVAAGMAFIVVITVAATLRNASAEQAPASPGPTPRALSAARAAHNKEMARRLRSIQRRRQKLSAEWATALRLHREDEAASIRREQDALGLLQDELYEELEQLQIIESIDREGKRQPPQLERDVIRKLDYLDYREKQLTSLESDARSRYEVAVASQKPTHLLMIMKREVDAYAEAAAVFARRLSLYEQRLHAAGSATLAEIRTRAERAERDREHARYSGAAPSNDNAKAFAALVVAIGVTAAVAAILSNPDAAPDDRAAAERELATARQNARALCYARGGHFTEGMGTSIGTCLP